MEASGRYYSPPTISPGKNPPVPLGPQSLSGRSEEEENLLFLPGFHSGLSSYFLYRSKHPRPISPSEDRSSGLLISWFSSPLPTSAITVPSHSLLPLTTVSCFKTTVRNQTTNKQTNTVSKTPVYCYQILTF
jgi:hypothetical protein